MNIFISPHLDDAVLSCGGLIHQLTARGEAVLVLTLMTGDPPDTLPDTPLIRDLHRRWQAGENPYATRRREDIQALQHLGVSGIVHVGWLDCPYRTNGEGHALYTQNHHLFGRVHPDDPALVSILPIPETATVLYAPLGAGGHVDHRVVNHLVQQLSPDLVVYYYEEYPYSASGGEARRITDGSPDQQVGTDAVQAALQNFHQTLIPHLTYLSEADLSAKIEAIAYYQSQISSFWEDAADMGRKVRAYALEVAASPAERVWRVGDSQ